MSEKYHTRRPGIFERSILDAMRECLAGRPLAPELLAPLEWDAPPPPPPDGTNLVIDFHRQGDDDAAF